MTKRNLIILTLVMILAMVMVVAPVVALPVVTGAAVNTTGAKIIVTFDDSMDSPNSATFNYTVNGGPYLPFSSATINATDSNKNIDLTLTDGTTIVYPTDTVLVNYVGDDGSTGVHGITGFLANFTDQVATNGKAAPPTVTKAAVNTTGATIIVTFNKAMQNPSAYAGKFNYTVNGGVSYQSFSAAVLNATDGNTNIDLTLDGTAIAYGNTIVLNYIGASISERKIHFFRDEIV